MKCVQCKCSSILLLGAHSVRYSNNNYTVSVHISTPLHTPCTETTCYITFSPPKHLLPNTGCSRLGHKLDKRHVLLKVLPLLLNTGPPTIHYACHLYNNTLNP